MESLDEFPGPDEGLELVPTDERESTPEEDLDAAAQAALEDPFTEDEEDAAPLPYGRTWSFDYARQRFVRNGGRPAEAREQASLIEWCSLAIRTARGAHPIFTDDYGMERPDDPVGDVEAGEAISDYEERIREALTQHDRVTDVQDLEADYDPATGVLTVSDFLVVTDEEEPVRFGALTLATVPEEGI
jgi:hypothetical protein